MKWLVERDIFTENEAKLEQILKNDLIYFSNSISGINFSQEVDPPFIVYGSIVACRKLQKTGGISWLYDKVYDCNYYLHRFGNLALNNLHIYSTKSNLETLIDFFGSKNLFIKENNGYKVFTGRVFDDQTLSELKLVYPEDFLLLAPKKPIENEWRFIVSEGKILTGSGYGDTKDCPPDAFDFAEKTLDFVEYDPAPMWTLDICKSNDEFKVLEANSLLSAGWYDADLTKIVSEVNRLAQIEVDWKNNEGKKA